MSTEQKQNSWVQCQECGNIYQVPYQAPESEVFVIAYCSVCESRTGLNLGNNKDDIYLYMNPNVDDRYYP